MSIEDQARREAEERYPAPELTHPSWDEEYTIEDLLRHEKDAYAAALIAVRSKARPWVHEIIDAAVDTLELGPEDQDAVLRFGMKLQDMEDAERKAQPLTVYQIMDVVNDEAWTARDMIEDDTMSGITDHIGKMASNIHNRLTRLFKK